MAAPICSCEAAFRRWELQGGTLQVCLGLDKRGGERRMASEVLQARRRRAVRMAGKYGCAKSSEALALLEASYLGILKYASSDYLGT